MKYVQRTLITNELCNLILVFKYYFIASIRMRSLPDDVVTCLIVVSSLVVVSFTVVGDVVDGDFVTVVKLV